MWMALALLAAQAERPEPINIPDAEAVRTLHEFAACVARERTGEARAVLAMDFRSRGYERRLAALARSTNHCLRRRWMHMSNLTFAGSLAEQLFLVSHRSADAAALVSSGFPEARSRSETLSHCVVRHSPAEARAVLDTEVASSAEAAALNALRPAIAACLEGNEEAQLNRPGLRSLLALAFYRLAARTAGGRANP